MAEEHDGGEDVIHVEDGHLFAVKIVGVHGLGEGVGHGDEHVVSGHDELLLLKGPLILLLARLDVDGGVADEEDEVDGEEGDHDGRHHRHPDLHVLRRLRIADFRQTFHLQERQREHITVKYGRNVPNYDLVSVAITLLLTGVDWGWCDGERPAIPLHLGVERTALEAIGGVAGGADEGDEYHEELDQEAGPKDVGEPDQTIPFVRSAQPKVNVVKECGDHKHPCEVDTVDLPRGHVRPPQKTQLRQVVGRVVERESSGYGEEDELGRGDEEDVPAVTVRDVVGHFLVRVHLFHARHTIQNRKRDPVEHGRAYHKCDEDPEPLGGALL